MAKKSLLIAFILISILFTSCSFFSNLKKTQMFVVANGIHKISLNPACITNSGEQRIFDTLFEGLTTINPKTGEVQPGTAESWEFDKGNKAVTFHLRQTQWSDGTQITAQTVVDSWLYLLEKDHANMYSYLLTELIDGALQYQNGTAAKEEVGLQAIDQKTLKVYFTEARPDAVLAVSHCAFSILPMHVIEKFGNDWVSPENFVCNGPYKLKEFTTDGTVTVIKNNKYWNKENVSLSSISFIKQAPDLAAYELYKAGTIDWIPDIPGDAVKTIFENNPQIQKTPSLNVHYYYLNTEINELNNPKVRKALSLAINREELVDKILNTHAESTTNLVPAIPLWIPQVQEPYNVSIAQELLIESGYPNGKGFSELTITCNDNDLYVKTAEYIAECWQKKLNLKVKIEKEPWEDFLTKRRSNAYVVSRAGWTSQIAEPGTYLKQLVSTDSNNDGRFSSSEFDSLVRKALASESTEVYYETLQKAEQKAIAEEQAVIPLYVDICYNLFNSNKWYGWSKNIQNYHPLAGIKEIQK